MGKDSPLVSVIIPTHNRANLAHRAIESVLAQTYSNLECIVVDDASTDRTEDTIRAIKDDRLVYVRHKENKHASAARNTGISRYRGDLVAFLDDDDEWLPTKLERQVTLLQSLSEKYGMVYCWMDYFDQEGKLLHEHHPTLKGYVFPYLLDAQRLGGCPTLLVRHSVIERIGGFDETLPRGNDGDFIRRVCQKYEVDFVPEVLVKVHMGHGKKRIGDYDKEGIQNAITGEQAKLEKFSKELEGLPNIHASILLKIANHYSVLGEKSKANQLERKAIQLDKKVLLKKLYFSFPNLIQLSIRYLHRTGRKLKVVLGKRQDQLTLMKQRFLDRFKLNDLEKLYSEEWAAECLDAKWNNDIGKFTSAVFKELMPASVVDVGCGVGLYLKYYKELGAERILGIEGNSNAINQALISEVLQHDLREPVRLSEKYELVSCLEVSEHIHKKYSNVLVDTLTGLCKAGGYIVFTAAPPGQSGIHHINLQPRNFWIDKFIEEGCEYLDSLTAMIVSQLELEHLRWVKQNLMIFTRPSGP